MSKLISGQFELSFTTKESDNLPTMHTMTHELQELFASALDRYLSDKDIGYLEVHAILADKLDCEDSDDS
jgi:hypothetical protein